MATTVESLSLTISSNSASAVNGINALTQSLAKLKTATKGFGTATVTRELKDVSSTSKTASMSFTDFYNKISMVAQAFRVLSDAISSVVSRSTEYIETVNLFTVSLGEYADEAMAYANSASEILGIDPAEWLKGQGTLMTLARGFGVAGERAYTMSTQLTQLAYDISSFQNISVEEAMQKLQSGLAGELEPLRRIGYDLSQARLEATALALGIDKSVSSMTQAEKAELRYYAIMTQVTHQHGDMAATIEDPANQLRILKARFEVSARSVGNIFIPALQKLLPYAIAITDVFGEMAQAMAMAFGFEMPEVDTSRIEDLSDVAASTESSMDEATDSAKKLKSYMLGFDELNVIKANEGSGEEDNSSGAFDFELPTYDFLRDATNERIEGIIDAIKESFKDMGDLFDFSSLTERITEVVKTIKKQFKGLDFKVPLFNYLEQKFATIYSWLNLIIEVAGKFIEALNIPQILYDGLSLMGSLWGTINDVITAVTPGILKFVDSLTPVVEWVSGAVSDAFRVFNNILEKLGKLFTDLTPTFTSIGESLGEITGTVWELIEPLLSTVWDNTLSFIEEVFDSMTPVIEKLVELADVILQDVSVAFEDFAEILEPFAEFIEGVLSDVFSEILSPALEDLTTDILPVLIETVENLWKNVLVPLGELIGSVFTPVIETLSDVLGYVWTYIILPLSDALSGVFSEAFTNVCAILNEEVIPRVQEVISVATFLWKYTLEPIIDFLWASFSPTFEEVFKAIGKIIASLKKVFSGLIDFITGVFTGDWKKAWNGISEFFSGIWDGFKTIIKTPLNFMMAKIEGFVNAVIDGWNWLKKQINSLSIDIPEWLGGGTLGFDLAMSSYVTLPRFAEGGFPEQGQMFIAREAGAEMVGSIGRRTAVANNDQIVGGIASGVAEANEEQNALLREQNSLLRSILEKDSGVYLDGKSLTNSVEKYQRERGRVLISGGVM